MSSIEETMERVSNLRKSLEKVKTTVSTIEEVDSLKELDESLGLRSSAELNVGLAFAVSSLYFMMLKTKGIATANHPIKEDLTRIKQYVGKIRQLDTGDGDRSEPSSSSKRRKVSVDGEAAKRVVQHELASNNMTSKMVTGTESHSSSERKAQKVSTISEDEKKNSLHTVKKSTTPNSQKKKKKNKKK